MGRAGALAAIGARLGEFRDLRLGSTLAGVRFRSRLAAVPAAARVVAYPDARSSGTEPPAALSADTARLRRAAVATGADRPAREPAPRRPARPPPDAVRPSMEDCRGNYDTRFPFTRFAPLLLPDPGRGAARAARSEQQRRWHVAVVTATADSRSCGFRGAVCGSGVPGSGVPGAVPGERCAGAVPGNGVSGSRARGAVRGE